MTRPKLLLADDSVTIRKVVELTFADEGIDVSTAADAESAMQKFVEIQPDILLVDVGLAGTSGYQICEMIKADEATSHLPVLLLVGSFEPFDQDEAERVGADGFLTKPFHSIRDLVARVTDLLGPRSDAEPINTEETDGGSIDVEADGGSMHLEEADAESIPLEEAAAESIKAEEANGGSIHVEGAAAESIDVEKADETADIDDLYTSSFVETAEIDEFDTVDDMLGDSGMDDELIETTYPTESFGEDVLGFAPVEDEVEQTKDEVEQVVEQIRVEGKVEQIRAEDEVEQTEAEDEVESVNEVESVDEVELTKVEDEIEQITLENEVEQIKLEIGVEQTAAVDEVESVDEVEQIELEDEVEEIKVEDEVEEIEQEDQGEHTKEFDWSPESVVTESPPVQEANGAFEVKFAFDEPVGHEIAVEDEPVAAGARTLENIPEVGEENGQAEPSPEFIALVAQRVVEKLSDQIIREIAQHAVPRIADKLIREALKEDEKA